MIDRIPLLNLKYVNNSENLKKDIYIMSFFLFSLYSKEISEQTHEKVQVRRVVLTFLTL